MTKQKDILLYLKNNKKLFYKQFNIIRIGIFGSFARNEETANSDIDILITMTEGTEDIFEKRLALKNIISEYFSCPVDICHEKAIKPVFKQMILKDIIYV